MVTLTFSAQEIQLILKAIQVTDPHNMYTGVIIDRIVKETNEQLRQKEESPEITNSKK